MTTQYWIDPAEPLIALSDRRKEKSISLTKLHSLLKEHANGDLMRELQYAGLMEFVRGSV